MYIVLKSLLLPPAPFFVAILAGCLIWRRAPKIGAALASFGVLAMYGLSTPIVGTALLAALEQKAHRAEIAAHATVTLQAIVILSAGRKYDAPENTAETVGPLTLTRLRYGARLHRETKLPVLVTGGRSVDRIKSMGELMRDSLESDFGISVRWVETMAKTTLENAQRSAELLRRNGIDSIYLVTHTWHLPRAQDVFEKAGLKIMPYGADRTRSWMFHWDSTPEAPNRIIQNLIEDAKPTDFLPSARAGLNSYYALHEWLGLIWYQGKAVINR